MDAQQTSSRPAETLLLDIKQLALLLCRSERSLWRDDTAGRLPKPVSLGGSKRWRRQEILGWVEAGCPDRRTWEIRRPLGTSGR